MRILLLGEYSNVHATLAEGLRALGHYVLVASDGDEWKDYPRDIDLRRPTAPSRSAIEPSPQSEGDGEGLTSYLKRVLPQVGSTFGNKSEVSGWRGLGVRLRGALYLISLLCYQLRLLWLFATRFRGFDVVQVINPVFLPLRAERIWPYYRWLRRHNGRIFMAAYGMDHYWVRAGLDCTTFRYSDFNFGPTVRTDIPENAIYIRDWLDGPKGRLNRRMAADCDGIPAGLYEYWASYSAYLDPAHRHKLRYLPFPIQPAPAPLGPPDRGDEGGFFASKASPQADAERGQVSECRDGWGEDREAAGEAAGEAGSRVRFFLGIQRSRSAYKGTDVMLRALRRVEARYPDFVEARVVENVPFAEYVRLLSGSDVILDQLYSYTPAMNALQAMSQGLVVVGGAEPEYYALQGCAADERPIYNVLPSEDSVYRTLCHIVEHRSQLPILKRQSIAFIHRHHHYLTIAQRYLEFWRGEGER